MTMLNLVRHGPVTEVTVETGFWLFKKRTTYRSKGECQWIEVPREKLAPVVLTTELEHFRGQVINEVV